MITIITQDRKVIKCDEIVEQDRKYFLLKTKNKINILTAKANCRTIIDI